MHEVSHSHYKLNSLSKSHAENCNVNLLHAIEWLDLWKINCITLSIKYIFIFITFVCKFNDENTRRVIEKKSFMQNSLYWSFGFFFWCLMTSSDQHINLETMKSVVWSKIESQKIIPLEHRLELLTLRFGRKNAKLSDKEDVVVWG